jgi:hypothetical protein
MKRKNTLEQTTTVVFEDSLFENGVLMFLGRQQMEVDFVRRSTVYLKVQLATFKIACQSAVLTILCLFVCNYLVCLLIIRSLIQIV